MLHYRERFAMSTMLKSARDPQEDTNYGTQDLVDRGATSWFRRATR